MYTPLPEAINGRVEKIFAHWRDKHVIPRFAMLPPGSRNPLVYQTTQLNAEQLQQLVEHHTQGAARAIMRFEATQIQATARTAADHVTRANLYRTLWHNLVGTEQGKRDVPFPCVRDGELAALCGAE